MNTFHGNSMEEVLVKINNHVKQVVSLNPEKIFGGITILWSQEDKCWKGVILN